LLKIRASRLYWGTVSDDSTTESAREGDSDESQAKEPEAPRDPLEEGIY
jgi:hypothetical protein